jgi:2-polyprenyl-6-methoxyphenol hydroxylase-like FAD-dependent oxidoreductase
MAETNRPSILIAGVGIAGPALAHWLLRAGFAPMLIERAPELREEGYIIDFWGKGYDLVEKMGLLPQVLDAGYQVRELRLVDRQGRRAGGFDASVLRAGTHGRFTTLPRSALSAILYRSIEGRAEVRFGDSITRMVPSAGGMLVSFEKGPSRRYDLVVGADGLHSTVRRLAFGPEQRFERYLGYTVAAFETTGYRPRDEDVYVAHAAPGVQIARFSLRNDRTLFLFVAADADARARLEAEPAAQRAYVIQRFGTMGWESGEIIAQLARGGPLYFDRMSQIRMDRWSSGCVVLVGDAAWAPSLLAGEGSGLALIGAYVLAGELAARDRPDSAFVRYEARLRAFMAGKQDAAIGVARSFAPKTRFGVFLRNQVTKAFAVPFVAKLAVGSLQDRIDLPHYPLLDGSVDATGQRTADQRRPEAP